MSTRGTMTPFTMSDGAQIGVYHVQPVGERRGGLVLIQEIFGINAHIREQAQHFATQGFEVMAPALFDREAPGLALGHSPDDKARGMQLARQQHPFALSVADTQTCIDALAPRGAVCIVGYCYGGSVTWAAACRCTGLAAASAYYGSQMVALANEQPKCPTIAHFGRHDEGIPLEGVEKLQAAHPEVPVYLYDAGHAFNSDRPGAHHEESARLAYERTLALFQSVV